MIGVHYSWRPSGTGLASSSQSRRIAASRVRNEARSQIRTAVSFRTSTASLVPSGLNRRRRTGPAGVRSVRTSDQILPTGRQSRIVPSRSSRHPLFGTISSATIGSRPVSASVRRRFVRLNMGVCASLHSPRSPIFQGGTTCHMGMEMEMEGVRSDPFNDPLTPSMRSDLTPSMRFQRLPARSLSNPMLHVIPARRYALAGLGT
jgi:hypothetical protein